MAKRMMEPDVSDDLIYEKVESVSEEGVSCDEEVGLRWKEGLTPQGLQASFWEAVPLDFLMAVKITEHLERFAQDGNPLNRLYAAGELTGEDLSCGGVSKDL